MEFAFAGLRAGHGPGTWGQRAIWDVVRGLGTDAARYNVTGGRELVEPLPAARVADLVRALLARHDSLHTLLDADGDTVRQRVVPAGAVPVVVRSGIEAGEVLPATYALFHELQATPFDPLTELPLRVGLVIADGLVRYVVFSMPHTASDGWGLRNLLADWSALASGAEPSGVLRQPLEEAAFQHSDRGRRRDAAARRSWLDKLARGPHRPFPVRGTAEPVFPNAVLNSPALALALDRLAADAHAVLLAATAAAAARLTGATDTVFQVVVNNRFLPGLAGGVTTVAQEGLLHLPGTDEPFPALVRRAFGAALSAHRHAYYDKVALRRDIAGADACDHSCFVNDTRGLMPALGYAKPTPAALAEALSRTTLSWPVDHEPRLGTTFALDAQDAPGSLELAMTADSALIPRADMARLLYGIESLVVDHALASAQPPA
ncbi:condensation domain-containing protein [Dactylosporangium sp. NPDC005572]|uniref:condensation domain-containing protein n=1 Tax=Dactylosporangium sp. NPDC005572 TaxID=3156889 RepID=UPI0033B8BA66